MAKAKFLPMLTRRGSSLKSSSSKRDAGITTPASKESDIIKSHEEVLILLSKFPESESESDRELSFSFLVNNSSPEKDDISEKGRKTDNQCKEVAAGKEKRKRRISSSSFSSSQIGVLLNLHVPVSFTDNNRSQSGREMPCTTLAELEKREMEFSKFGCWPTLLRRKQDHDKLPIEAVPELTY